MRFSQHLLLALLIVAPLDAQPEGLELIVGDQDVAAEVDGPNRLTLELETEALRRWADENPELLARLEELMGEDDPSEAPPAGLTAEGLAGGGSATQRTDAWLLANEARLRKLPGLASSQSEDDLVRVLQLRRGVVAAATAPMAETAATVDNQGWFATILSGAKSLAWGLISKVTGD